MKPFLRFGRVILVMATATFGLVSLAGCDSPTDPSGQPAAMPHLVERAPQSKGAAQGTTLLGSTVGLLTGTVTSLVTTLGGTLANGPYTLTIPAGALTKTTTISISEVSASVMECDCEPTGLTFQTPVTLVFNYAGTDADPSSPNYKPGPLTCSWLDPSTSRWVSIGGVDDTTHKTFTATLSHFSYYALSK